MENPMQNTTILTYLNKTYLNQSNLQQQKKQSTNLPNL